MNPAIPIDTHSHHDGQHCGVSKFKAILQSFVATGYLMFISLHDHNLQNI
jgi:hypothetical protein